MLKRTLVFVSPPPLSRTLVWDIGEPALRSEAYVDLFAILDREMRAYEKDTDAVTCALLDLARAQNPEACEALLCFKRNRSGQTFQEVDVRASVGEPVLLERSKRKVVMVPSPEEMELPSTGQGT